MIDLIQEGNMGLIKAVERFDISKGHKLSIYAKYWIKKSICRALDNNSRTIRLPEYIIQLALSIKKYRITFFKQNGKFPSVSEISKALNIPEKKVNFINQVNQDIISLSAEVGLNEDTELIGTISYEDEVPVIDEVSSNQLGYSLEDAMNLLSRREKNILRYRYGLIDSKERTLVEVAKIFGISHERVRMIEKEALQKLKRLSKQNGLGEYLNITEKNNKSYKSFSKRKKVSKIFEYHDNTDLAFTEREKEIIRLLNIEKSSVSKLYEWGYAKDEIIKAIEKYEYLRIKISGEDEINKIMIRFFRQNCGKPISIEPFEEKGYTEEEIQKVIDKQEYEMDIIDNNDKKTIKIRQRVKNQKKG